jgi:signal transduction histidine kinase
MMLRLIAYWVASVMFITLPLAFFRTFAHPDCLFTDHLLAVWREHWTVFATATTLLPFVLFDFLKFSNRFVGPIHRMRQELNRFSQGERMRKITFREQDFWTDLSVGLNKMTQRIEELELQSAKDSPVSDQTPGK